MITLSDGTDTLELPIDLQWVDEFDWSDIEQEEEYSLTGALIINQGEKLQGRPITLESGGGAWITRANLLVLRGFYSKPGTTYTLGYWGVEYTVQFRRPDGLKAQPVFRKSNPGPDHVYTITLQLFEVSP